MTPEQIKTLAKQAGAITAVLDTIIFNTDELTEFVRLVREVPEGMQPPKALMQQLINDKVELQAKVDELKQANSSLADATIIKEGYQLVPIEPTQEMLDAMRYSAWLPGIYKAMLKAARGETL